MAQSSQYLDASRFLAQSQSRLAGSQTDANNTQSSLVERRDQNQERTPARSYLQRQARNAYGSNNQQAPRFPFAYRLSSQQAPLFHSTAEDVREEDDNEEHEREVADFYALQRSRRDFGPVHQGGSSDEDRKSRSRRQRNQRLFGAPERRQARLTEINSSWNEDDDGGNNPYAASQADTRSDNRTSSEAPRPAASSIIGEQSITNARDKARLVDVDLDSTIHELNENVESSKAHPEDTPPSIQRLGEPEPMDGYEGEMFDSASFLSQRDPMDQQQVGSDILEAAANPSPAKHDAFWASLFLIDLAALVATLLLVAMNTSSSGNGNYGDTVYTTLRSSYHLLAVDTTVAVVVALVWLAALRSFARPMILILLAAVPIIAVSFSLYPFISSFGGTWHGHSLQDKAMRIFALVPGIFALLWTYVTYKSRKSLSRAIDLLEFTTRILAACPTLILVGFGTLAVVVVWTWVWMVMFTRVFLGGHFSSTLGMFIINTSTWWLGVFFILTYLWSLGIISGVQRATSAAATSQWYFHRNVQPAPSPQRIVKASLVHAGTTLFGTICFSSLLTLAVRLPLLLLPTRLSGYLTFCFYAVAPTSIATLTNPLTLTYAAIHSQPLSLSARGLSELSFISPTSPTTTLTPSAFSRRHPYNSGDGTPSLIAYRLAKLLMHATRWIVSLALGFGGWVSTARMLNVSDSVRGSMYAYIVGLVASVIGWAVLGAMEGILGGVLDAVVVCWANDVATQGSGQARYCREAGELLGNDTGGGETVV